MPKYNSKLGSTVSMGTGNLYEVVNVISYKSGMALIKSYFSDFFCMINKIKADLDMIYQEREVHSHFIVNIVPPERIKKDNLYDGLIWNITEKAVAEITKEELKMAKAERAGMKVRYTAVDKITAIDEVGA